MLQSIYARSIQRELIKNCIIEVYEDEHIAKELVTLVSKSSYFLALSDSFFFFFFFDGQKELH